MNEVLVRVRRLLRGEPQAVAAAFEEAEGKGGSLGPLQLLQLLRQQQLLPGMPESSSSSSRKSLVSAHIMHCRKLEACGWLLACSWFVAFASVAS